MLKLGKKQTLKVVKKTDFGVYLAQSAETASERVLLPKKQVPSGCGLDAEIDVFIYRDSQDRLIATTAEPYVLLGQTAVLKVTSIGKIGAFLDWGLEKDLFLPFKEQTKRLSVGEDVLIALYLDKSERLCATMKVFSYLSLNPPYFIGDMLSARVYNINQKYGVFVAIEDKYSGLIPNKEAKGSFEVGDMLLVRVVNIREDGRTDVSPNEKAYLKIKPDAEAIYKKIVEYGGTLPFDDHASPELINETFGISKAAFKRAVGHLYKEKKIKISDGRISRL